MFDNEAVMSLRYKGMSFDEITAPTPVPLCYNIIERVLDAVDQTFQLSSTLSRPFHGSFPGIRSLGETISRIIWRTVVVNLDLVDSPITTHEYVNLTLPVLR